jgi:hypothetical protein
MALKFDMAPAMAADVFAPFAPVIGDETSFAAVDRALLQCAPDVHPETDTCP